MAVNCPECGDTVNLRSRQSDSCETHGLESGPFEHFHDEWYECPVCHARFTERELTEHLVAQEVQ